MNRRSVLRSLLAATAATTPGFGLALAGGSAYRGKFLVSVQADGGWDPTSFCDPKENVPGEPVINHWAERDEVRRAGNIDYAPFAGNEAFFEKYHSRMLVINGVDAQTNSHTAGIVHNWSGRISEGYPTTTALFAAVNGSGLSMGYLTFGGFSKTGSLTRFTRLDRLDTLLNIAAPEALPGGGPYFDEYDWGRLEHFRETRAGHLVGEEGLLPRARWNRGLFQSALDSVEGLSDYVAVLPPELAGPEFGPADAHSTLRRQVQLAVLAFRTGVAVSADLWLGGFDTHGYHDTAHEWLLGNLTDAVDDLWEYAEQHGVAEDLIVVIGSDFGRTNHYNSQDGKDHWPYGSFVVMEKNQPSWTNRVVGETDELHHAYNIEPATLERVGDNDPNGTHIYPKHVHKALRKYLGIERFAKDHGFPFNNTEDFAFFS